MHTGADRGCVQGMTGDYRMYRGCVKRVTGDVQGVPRDVQGGKRYTQGMTGEDRRFSYG